MDFGTIILGITLFAATNVDDIFVLIGFFADPRFGNRQVVAGQYIGIAVLIGVSVAAALISLVIPGSYIGLLGLVPFGLGLMKLYELRKGDEGGEEEAVHADAKGGLGKTLAVAGVTIANGGDNIGVYTPLFATRPGAETLTIVIIFLLMTAVWCMVSHWLVNHRTIGAPIRKYGQRILPVVLIGLGVLILYEAGSFALIGL